MSQPDPPAFFHFCLTFIQPPPSLSFLAGLDISSMADEPSFTCKLTESGGRGHKAEPEEPLDVILSPELDQMVSDGKRTGLSMVCVLL